QVAAGTLDASAKIYAVRVDSVHADTYRVLGGLGKDSALPKELEHPQRGENSRFAS
ncbi:CND2 protein, partial [Dasyornis broadbenti]|nr:CND2 protein [Dasyornis broadbenti]